jgi:RNA polymerase sigma-70 factor, ECF subfamily
MEGVCSALPLRVPVTPYRLQSCTDEELMEQLRMGQADALAVLFDRHYRLVFGVALRILHDHGEAEDLMQEVFLEIYRKIEDYDPDKGNAKTWILQYAYHRSLNRQKYLSVRSFYDGRQDSDLAQFELPQSPNGWNGLTYDDWAQVLQKGMSSLSEKERMTLDLAYFQGLQLKEIAAQFNEPLGNIRNHYYRGLKKLRDFLQERSCLKKKPA